MLALASASSFSGSTPCRVRSAGWRVGSPAARASQSKSPPPPPAKKPKKKKKKPPAAPAPSAPPEPAPAPVPPPEPAPAPAPSAAALDRPWWGDSPELEAKVPSLLQAGRFAEARALLCVGADEAAPITQFYLGIAVGGIDGEAASCEHYERALAVLPTLHSARNNLIRGLLKRATPASFAAALAHAEASAELQPDAAEMRYQLGVVRMHCNDLDAAADAYEGTLEIDASHVGALVNGAHVLAQLAADGDARQRARLLRVARLGVAAGLWAHELQRPPHRLPELCPGRPWHDKRAFGFVALLEAAAPQIRAELLALRGGGAASAAAAAPFSAVGGRAAHDASLVAAGAWREYPFLGGGMRHDAHCARCPVTASVLERIPEAVGCAMSGGGESLFSCLAPGTHLRAHCGSTNARLTCHLGLLVPGGATIRCGTEAREWAEGECIVFDDSFEHEVWHEGSADRVVLLINFWHPMLPPDKRRIDMSGQAGAGEYEMI